MVKVLTIIGTRPEAIKVSILHKVLLADEKFEPQLISTGQHDGLLLEALSEFGLIPDVHLDAIKHNSSFTTQQSYILTELQKLIDKDRPNLIIVQGDTLSALCGAQAAFYNKVKCAHIEAGLRTYNKWGPYPEEIYRRSIDLMSDYHFCPSENAKNNLASENISNSSIYVTGNTVIDALLHVKNKIEDSAFQSTLALHDWVKNRKSAHNKLFLLTLHRREIHGEAYEKLLLEIDRICKTRNHKVVYPLHPNPKLKESIARLSLSHIEIIEPLSYSNFVWLMMQSDLIITDSGGVQEEAPYLGVNTIVLRNETERIEITATPNNKISSVASLEDDIELLLSTSPIESQPYGDGIASKKIVAVLSKDLC